MKYVENTEKHGLTANLPLSVYMITYNNGPTIRRALESLTGWASEIVVVDSESIDGSKEIASEYTTGVFQFMTTDLRDKYQFAQDQCSCDWVLFLDADEWLTKEIKGEITEEINHATGVDGFVVKRRNYYLGREIRFGAWASDEEIRLYRRNKGQWEGGIHAKIHVTGRTGRLKSYYLHTPFSDISHQIRKGDHYSAVFAQELIAGGRRFHLASLIGRPLFRFFRDYVLKLGFADGIPGLIIAVSTMYYVFLKYAKAWELSLQGTDKDRRR
jgi:glycosyltransferase involved in cell wall biosynthesis